MRTIEGGQAVCTLKVSKQVGRLSFEEQVLQTLAEFSLFVPKVTVKPVTFQSQSGPQIMMLISELPGQPLPWINLNDLNAAHQTCELVHQAVDTLHDLTHKLKSHPIASVLPTVTLESELQTIRKRDNEWLNHPIFDEALALLQATIPRVSCPLVFSNGDYNPLNFLTVDDRITGWLDFEHACFEDPYIGFAKFILWADDDYGWSTGIKSGLVERYLFKHNVTPSTFLVRLILRGLSYIQQTNPTDKPHHMLNVTTNAVRRLKKVT